MTDCGYCAPVWSVVSCRLMARVTYGALTGGGIETVSVR